MFKDGYTIKYPKKYAPLQQVHGLVEIIQHETRFKFHTQVNRNPTIFIYQFFQP